MNSSLLTISVIAILLPAAFNFTASTLTNAEALRDILSVSHGVCVSYYAQSAYSYFLTSFLGCHNPPYKWAILFYFNDRILIIIIL